MRNHEIEALERHLGVDAKCPQCRQFGELVSHAKALRGFVVDLADHYDTPGPSPEKTAEHYQLVERARLLRAQIQP